MSRSDAWGTVWMVIAMLLLATLIVVCALAWGKPWEGWGAVGALGGWAAAAGTFAAVFVALRLAERDEDRRRNEERQAVERVRMEISVVVNGFHRVRSEMNELRQLLDSSDGFRLHEAIRLAEGVKDKVTRMPYLDWRAADAVLALDVSSLLSQMDAVLHALKSAEKESGSTHEARLSDARNHLEIAIYLSRRVLGAHPARRALKGGPHA